MVAEVEQPGSARPVLIANSPVKMTETPGRVRRRGPLLGEHTREVLATLGYAGEQINELIASGAVKAAD